MKTLKQKAQKQAQARRYRAKHAAHIREHMKWYRKSYLQRPEVKKKIREYQQRYTKTPTGRFAQLRSASKQRKISLSLSFEQWQTAIHNPCTYCGKSLAGEGGYCLDRLDHRAGYNEGNVAPCCSACNYSKGQLEGMGFVYPRTAELMRELRGKH